MQHAEQKLISCVGSLRRGLGPATVSGRLPGFKQADQALRLIAALQHLAVLRADEALFNQMIEEVAELAVEVIDVQQAEWLGR